MASMGRLCALRVRRDHLAGARQTNRAEFDCLNSWQDLPVVSSRKA